ncbi:MAG: carboxypeptidase-like regulatory domain-containing protein [Bacteroidales bacterium]|nr:MAG: carboxypeptidase-like regulatory domain-containing protein [Bacteroidales bacterium]
MMGRSLFVLVLIFCVICNVTAQTDYAGMVTDSRSGNPLAFVTIVFNNSGRGTTTRMDGRFSIPARETISTLLFSCVGYESKTIHLKSLESRSSIRVRLKPKSYSIDEVKIYPGINPAHRIINEVYKNRNINDPEERQSFDYTAYNKFYVTLNLDSLTETDSIILPEFDQNLIPVPEDTSLTKLKDLVWKQHLFLMESVSKRQFIYPDLNSERVIASRVSGFRNPTFSIIATQVQSFSFYKDFITIMEKSYLNPVSKGSTNKYLFILEDTLLTESDDTIFVISFKPKKGRMFDGLEGFLHINTNRYAIQNVSAKAAGPNDFMNIKIQQKYEFLEGIQWFPVELNTDLIFQGPAPGKSNATIGVLGIGKSYLKEIRLNPGLEPKRYHGLEFEVESGATKRSEEFWESQRTEPLTSKDSITYHVVDSLGRSIKLDEKLRTFETFVTGYIPFHFINIDYTSILNYNDYEGFRIGIGLNTNNKLSRFISLGGYIAYGFRDRGLKYGGSVSVKLKEDPEIRVDLQYRDDVEEPGGYHFLQERTEFSSEYYRNFLIEDMDRYIQRKVSIVYHAHRHVKAAVFLNNRLLTFGNDYLYSPDDTNPQVYLDRYQFTELGCSFRIAYKEKFLKISDQFVSMGTRYPVLNGNIIQGIHWFDSRFSYTKFEMKLSKIFKTRSLGEFQLTLTGGLVKGEVPFPILYNGHGSYKDFTVETANSFATMRMDEFVSDRFISLFHMHNFGKFTPASWKFRPEFVWINNIGIGDMKPSGNHSNLYRKTMEKGYFESGILVNNLITRWVFGVGLGAFYRYGPYALTKTIDNFAFKFTISLNV